MARTVCIAQGTAAACLCDEGFTLVDGACVKSSACTPNPCSGLNQTVCVEEGSQAKCACDPGYVPLEDGSCSADPLWDCSVRHTSGVPDVFEPNDCPPNAHELSTAAGFSVGHSINPPGDQDWFFVSAQAGQIYELRAKSSADVPLYLDIFDGDGVTPLAADHRGGTEVIATVKAASTGPLYMRVKALRMSDVGSFIAGAMSLGYDDFGDSAATATSLQAGATVTGGLQFHGDVDVVKLALTGGETHEFVVSHNGTEQMIAELVESDGVTVRQRGEGNSVKLLTRMSNSGVLYLRLSARSQATVTGYTLASRSLGADDHGEVPAEATPIVPSSSPTQVSLQRLGDVDVLAFDVVSARVYSVTCASSSYTGVPVVMTNEQGTVVAQQQYGSTIALTTEADSDGKRYVHVGTDSTTVLATFQCTLKDLGTDDHGDTPSAATAISPSSAPGAGILEMTSDRDVFSFAAAQGRLYRITCTFSPSSNGCALRVMGVTGNVLATGAGTFVWEAGAAGTYYLEVGPSYSSSGSYSYVLEDIGTDDHGDDPLTATAATVGAPAQAASLETAGDKDVFSFAATAPRIYRLICIPAQSGSCTIRLLSSTGLVLATASGYSGQSVQVGHEVSAAGTYFMEVSTYSYSTMPSYNWYIEDAGVDDYGDTSATATSVAVGDTGAAQFEFAGDVDTFSFPVAAGRIYKVTCTRGTATGCPVRLRDANGAVLATGITTAVGVETVAVEATSATTWVADFGAYSSYSRPTGSYSWAVTDAGVDDHGDALNTATAVTLPMAAAEQAALESLGDVDVFRFTATASHIYRFTCTRGSATQCVVRAKDASGNVVSSGGTATIAAFTARASASYYFEVDAGSYSSGVIGTYSYLLEDLGPDDHGDAPLVSTALTLGTPMAGEIQHAADVDVFSFPVTAGRLYRVTCSPTTSTSCTVQMTNSAGTILAQGSGAASVEAPGATTTLYATIRPSYSSTQSMGYSVFAEDIGVDDHGDTSASATALQGLGVATAGILEISGDVDYFSLSLAANTSYTASVTGSYSLDVLVSGPGGNISFGSSPRTFTTTVAGTYYFRVNAWSSSSTSLQYSIAVQ